MAPASAWIIKASLAALSLVSLTASASPAPQPAPNAAVAGGAAPYLHQHNPHAARYGRHHKYNARTGGVSSNLENLARRAADAPYGYDRCGWPRKRAYVRRNGTSPRPSPSLKPCATYGPGLSTDNAVPIGNISQDLVKNPSENTLFTSTSSFKADSVALHEDASSSSGTTLFTPISDPPAAAAQSPSASASSLPSSSTVNTKSVAIDLPVNAIDNNNPVAKPVVSSMSSSSAPSAPSPSKPPAPEQQSTSSSSSQQSAAPNSTPQATPNAPNPPPVQNYSKRLGLAWDWRNPAGAMYKWAGVGQAYTWSEWPPTGGMPDGASWLPMFTCTDKAAGFAAQVARGAIHPGMDILTFNEPDQPGQCPMSAADGAGAFRELITKPYANKGYTLWSPAPTNSPAGRQWLADFMSMCSDCGIGGIAIHWYGTSADDFISYVQGVYDQYKMPIKVTEFAPMDFTYATTPLTAPQISAFLAKTQAWLNQQSFITGYYFFGAVTTPALGGANPNVKLITDGGDLTNLGWQYLGNGK